MFVTTAWKHARSDDGTGHGIGFRLLSDAINKHGGYEITVFHTFHDEVDSYRRHIWQCDGPCKDQPPQFGLVKRTMNRPPGTYDDWWKDHQEKCGGTFVKIAEPELTKQQINAMSAKKRAGLQKNKIDSWVKSASPEKKSPNSTESTLQQKRRRSTSPGGPAEKRATYPCPICDAPVTEQDMSNHLDEAHGP